MSESGDPPPPESTVDPMFQLGQTLRRAMQASYGMIARNVESNYTAASDIEALVHLLIAKGVIGFTEIAEQRAEAARRVDKVRQKEWDGPWLTPQLEQDPTPVVVDCEARYPACKAACCSIYRVNLTSEEVKEGKLLWDMAVPYSLPRTPDGDCAYLNLETRQCSIWQNRPYVCRQYSCAGETQIWEDFEQVITTERVKAMSRPPQKKGSDDA